MMLFEPTLIVLRLVVERNAQVVYSEAFHYGVNVIRGENSSGKSTVLNFIYYGLGGDLADWSEKALLCSRVFVEVELNGRRATLSRDISDQHGQPMYIFGDAYELARKAPSSDWLKYPYRRSNNQESFSQALFRLLGIPEVASDLSGNVTIHQILRLLYADQLSPVDEIFRFERFDQPALRDAVGRLLCGAYDSSLYDNELKIRALAKEFDAADAELKSLFLVLGQTGQPITPEWLDVERKRLNQQRAELQEKIARAERRSFEANVQDKLTLRAQREAYDEVQRLQGALGLERERRDSLALTIADSAAFMLSLEHKIEALNDSDTVAAHVGDVHFSVCPACYATLDSKASAAVCHLCKTPFDGGRSRDRIVGLINDAAVQLRQSRELQVAREARLRESEKTLIELEDSWAAAARRLTALQLLPSSEVAEELRSLNRQMGYLDREAENIEAKAELIGLVTKLTTRRSELNEEINGLKARNEALRISQEKRLSQSYTLIADNVRTLLKHDLRRQDSFEDPKAINFSFLSNRISVDGHTYFSASSRVILKSSFFLGFFAAAVRDKRFRHPRFVMIDTIEDKGMEPERSHNFQNQILSISKSAAKITHQVIYATAMISPDLDDEQFTVGKYSTRDSPTLEMD